MRATRPLLLAGLVTAAATRLQQAPAATPAGMAYTLSARLDADAHEVAGQGTIHWVNTSQIATDELYFHLYLNAFEHSETLFFRSPFVRARGGRLPTRWGQISIERLSASELGDVDLLPRLASHSPGDPLDATDLRLELPRAIAPGETLTLAVAWKAVLPNVVDRTGFSHDFHFVAQWFPKLARLEPDGTWAHFAFHPHGEFYADFANYDVELDVPEGMTVGATGTRVSERVESGRKHLRYRAESVIDFAWTAWPGFTERRESIEGVAVRLLHPAGHDDSARATLEALRFALPHFSARYGPYAQPTLTVVHPPRHAAQAGGMEYPGLITTGGPWHATYWSKAIEAVTVHELGHQWFHALLASNEQRHPFLDEGLTSYAELLVAEARFGAGSAGSLPGFELSMLAIQRQSMRRAATHLPLDLPAAAFPSFRELGGLVYARTALLVRTLANVYGEPEMRRALARYAREQRMRHPEPEDLLSAIEIELGPDAASNARSALLDGSGVDYRIGELRSAPLSAPSGTFLHDPHRPERSGLVQSRIVVHRSGALSFPVEVVLTTERGERVRHQWDGVDRFTVLTHEGDSPVVAAVVDPEGSVLVDDDLLNNAVRARPASSARSVERAVYLTQLLLGWLEP